MIQLDREITLWLNSLGGPDGFWIFLSNARVWFPLYAIIGGFLIYRLGWKKGLVVIASLALLVFATDQLSVLVKDSVQRLRPCYDTWMLENGVHFAYKPRSHYGFFSSHASNTFGFAIASYLGFKNDSTHTYKPYLWGIMAWAVLVSLSRIMLAAHFMGDILAGAIFGLVLGYAISMLARIAVKRF